jgi:hypothetical protein
MLLSHVHANNTFRSVRPQTQTRTPDASHKGQEMPKVSNRKIIVSCRTTQGFTPFSLTVRPSTSCLSAAFSRRTAPYLLAASSLNEDHFSDWRGFLDFTYPLWKAMTTWMT